MCCPYPTDCQTSHQVDATSSAGLPSSHSGVTFEYSEGQWSPVSAQPGQSLPISPIIGSNKPRRRKRGPYTPRACDRCRTGRTKCIPQSENPPSCKKCSEKGETCAFTGPHNPSVARQRSTQGAADSLSTSQNPVRRSTFCLTLARRPSLIGKTLTGRTDLLRAACLSSQPSLDTLFPAPSGA